MLRSSLSRAVLLILVLLVAAPPLQARPGGVSGLGSWDLVAQAWGFFTQGWSKNGCEADPSGRCSKNGCEFDPNGHCRQEATTSENGCQLDPSGGCTKNGCQLDPDGHCSKNGCELDPNGRCRS